MTQTVPLTRLENVGRIFDGGAIVALRAVNLSIEEGECVAIVGKSGSGKSTLIHLLCGCDEPTSGIMRWRERPAPSRRQWQMLRATEIGIVFQTFNLLPILTALENVEIAMVGQSVSARERRRRALELLTRVGLEVRQNHLPAKLSGGERQRVAIARSIVNNPALLLADEPTGSLDSVNAAAVADLMFEIQRLQGATLVIATHDESLAARCRRRVVMRNGCIVDDSDAANAAGWGVDRLSPEGEREPDRAGDGEREAPR